MAWQFSDSKPPIDENRRNMVIKICPKCKNENCIEKIETGRRVIYYCTNCSHEWSEKDKK